MEAELRRLKEAAQAEKKQIELTLSNIVDNMPGHIYWKNKDGVYLGCNKQQAESLGVHDSSEVIGKSDFELFEEENIAAAIRENDIKIMQSGNMKLIEEKSQVNGKKALILSHKSPIFSTQGEVLGILGISIDISKQKKLEEKLRSAKEKAEASNQAKSEFLRNMEHQLRTPFSGVYSLVQMLADQETDPTKKELLEITYSSGKELLDFLNDVINFSRNQVETPAILAKKFDLKRLIERAVIMERPAAVMKGLALSFTYPEDLPTIFISDPKRIQRIVLNLLSNAVKFTAKGSINVAVKLGKQLDEKNYILRILVKDTGIGIAESNRSLIYEKFYRVSPAYQNKYAGAGLGLHIVKQLVTELEGEIDVQSQLDKGTIFICTLPLKRPLIDEIINDEEEPREVF